MNVSSDKICFPPLLHTFFTPTAFSEELQNADE